MVFTKSAVCLIITVFLFEVFCWLYFNHWLSESIKQSILFSVGRLTSTDWTTNVKIRPYLWSNYEPVPGTCHTNEYGWRYGGGPKKSALRILCLGGSTTWGDGVTEPSKSYPAQLEHILRAKGYDVDVVNGGCPYYTTAEMIGMLAFRGIYEMPQVILIHEGGNDIAPLASPREYKSDYSHWRTAVDRPSISDRLALLRALWRLPSWTIRVISWILLRPDPFSKAMLGVQLDSPQDMLLATNDISSRYNLGYENNLKTLVAISRIHGAVPIFMTFNLPIGKMYYLLPQMKTDKQLADHVNRRVSWAMEHNNEIMRSVGMELHVDVIPFDKWHPSHDDYWLDQAHLNDTGVREKAQYVSDWLDKHGILIKARVSQTNDP